MENQATSSSISCPHCGKPINVSDVLFHQVQDQLKKDFEAQSAIKDKEIQSKEQVLLWEREALEKAQASMQENVDTAVKKKLSAEKISLEKTLRRQIEEEKSEQVAMLETELAEKSTQITCHNKLKADYARLQRHSEEMKGQIEAETELKFNEQLAAMRDKIQAAEAEKNQTQMGLKDKLISDLTKKVEEVTLRLEQGSNKQVGEISEIALRDFLKTEFPFDLVVDVPSDVRGAEVIITVRNNVGAQNGTILFERKQTQNFSESWIGNLKENSRTVKADILVLVTRAMPKDNPESHHRYGVWVISFEDVVIIVTLLRAGLIKQNAAHVSQQNKGDKMTILYDYLLSNDVKNHIPGILDTFKKMDGALSKERTHMIKRLAEMEAYQWQAKQSVLSFWGRVEGIASDGLNQQMKRLEEPPQQIESCRTTSC